jgi:hypothetical protein
MCLYDLSAVSPSRIASCICPLCRLGGGVEWELGVAGGHRASQRCSYWPPEADRERQNLDGMRHALKGWVGGTTCCKQWPAPVAPALAPAAPAARLAAQLSLMQARSRSNRALNCTAGVRWWLASLLLAGGTMIMRARHLHVPVCQRQQGPTTSFGLVLSAVEGFDICDACAQFVHMLLVRLTHHA